MLTHPVAKAWRTCKLMARHEPQILRLRVRPRKKRKGCGRSVQDDNPVRCLQQDSPCAALCRNVHIHTSNYEIPFLKRKPNDEEPIAAMLS